VRDSVATTGAQPRPPAGAGATGLAAGQPCRRLTGVDHTKSGR